MAANNNHNGRNTCANPFLLNKQRHVYMYRHLAASLFLFFFFSLSLVGCSVAEWAKLLLCVFTGSCSISSHVGGFKVNSLGVNMCTRLPKTRGLI